MIAVNARSVAGPCEPFIATIVERRDLRPHDVLAPRRSRPETR